MMNLHLQLRLLRAAAALSACLLATPAVLAQEGPPDVPAPCDAPGAGAGGVGGPGARFLRGLDLSEAQQDRVFTILHEQVPQRRQLDQAERRAHEALRALAGGPALDQAKASTAARALGQAIADGEMLRLQTDARLLAVLTPAQRAELAARREERSGPPRRGGRSERMQEGAGAQP